MKQENLEKIWNTDETNNNPKGESSMTGKKETEITMPIKKKPYDHQQKAFDFICGLFGLTDGEVKSTGAALLMEMGTGKTAVCIALIGLMHSLGLVNRVLIVAPLTVLEVWKSEFEKFAAFPYSLTVLKGSTNKKIKQLVSIPDEGLQIVLINYESTRLMDSELLSFDVDLVIADEAHKIKDSRAKQSRAMHRIGDKARYRLLLTGTIITNRELDVFSQFRFLNPAIFGYSFYKFRSKYFDMTGYGNYIPEFRSYMTDEFEDRLHSISYRVTKAECLDLPETEEVVRSVELEPGARNVYESVKKDCYAELSNSEVTATNVLTKTLRLSQITGGHLTDDDGVVNKISTAKLDVLSDIIDSCAAEGEKLVIMVRFLPELEDIKALLEKKTVGHAVVSGSVKNRDEEIGRFQNDPDCQVFLGQISAAGLGISLTASSTMVFYSLDYNMSNFEQAKARIHRAGQTKNCQYIYLIAKETVDRTVLQALQQKQDLAKALIDDFRQGNESL